MQEILSYNDILSTYKTRGYRLNKLKEYMGLFPLQGSEVLAGIVADLMGDGSLQADPKWRLDFTAKEPSELKRFEKEMQSIFNIKGKIRKCKSNAYGTSYSIAFNSAPVARILWLIGVPGGQKVLSPFRVPKWILVDKTFFRRFVQRLFTCEGGIMHEKNRRVPQVRIEMWKSTDIVCEGKKFMEEISKQLEEHFHITSTVTVPNRLNKRKDGLLTQAAKIYILGEEVIKFYKLIWFEGEKQSVLGNILSENGLLQTFKS